MTIQQKQLATFTYHRYQFIFELMIKFLKLLVAFK